MTDDLLHRFSAFADLTPREREALHNLIGPSSSFDAMRAIRSEADASMGLFFLHAGWAYSSITLFNGNRQVLKVHRSGDMMGLPSLPYEAAVESLVTLTPARVSVVAFSKLGALFEAHPRLGALMFLAAQEERVTLMDRLAVAGQLSAKHSVVALLLLLFESQPPSEDAGSTLHIPLTQPQIGDVLGLSTVHINRVMLALEADGLIRRDGPNGRTYGLPDVSRLKGLIGMPERVRRRAPPWLPPPTP